MAKRPTLSDITTGHGTTTKLNANFDAIEQAFDNTLSRDGSSPNAMEADLDMNSNQILNLPDATTSSEPLTLRQYLAGATGTVNGFRKETQIATAGQTVFTANTVQWVPGVDNLVVFLDGVMQGSGNYSITSSTQITFSTGVPLNTRVDFLVMNIAGTIASTTTDAGLVTYQPAGTANVTNVESKLREFVSVKDFGAAGDGATDDTAAIQAAINYASPLGKTIIIPDGSTVLVTSALTVPSYVALEGTGTISYTGSGFMFPQSQAMTTLCFKNLTIKGSSQANSLFSYGFDLDQITFSNCEIRDFNKVFTDDGTTLAVTFKQISVNACFVQDCKSVFEFSANVIQDFIGNNNFFKSISNSGSVYCFLLGNNDFSSYTSRGDYIISNNTFRNITSTGISNEVHAAICYGKRAVISNNSVHVLNNAGTSGAEAFYTKCQFSTFANNVIEDGGYSLDGAIAVKGNTRSESAAPRGFSVSVIGNVISFSSHAGQTACGIGVRNESCTIIGNVIDGDSYAAIRVASDNATHNFNIANNSIGNSLSQRPITVETEVNDLTVSSNTISEWVGVSSVACNGIYIAISTGTVKNITVSQNTISAASGVVSTYQGGIAVFFGTSGTINRLLIEGNTVDTTSTGGASSRGIILTGVGTVDSFTFCNNIVESSTYQFDYGNNISVTGRAYLASNSLKDYIFDTTLTLDETDINRALIRKTATVTKHTLPSARIGLTYTAVKGNGSGVAAVGFQCSGSDTFRNSNTEATIAAAGSITVQCFESGFWDVVGATSTVTYA